MKNYSLLFFLFFFLFWEVTAQLQTEITTSELRNSIGFLASDSLKGRKPGTLEDNITANYIRRQFLEAGLVLMGNDGFQPFEVSKGAKLGNQNTFTIENHKPSALVVDFTPLSISSSGNLNAQVVFVGYGIENNLGFESRNDYKNMACEGKWVLLFSGLPTTKGEKSASFFDDFVTKVLTAKDHGAKGVLLVNPEPSLEGGKVMPFNFLRSTFNAGIPVLSVSAELANKILKSKKKTVSQLYQELNKNMDPVELPDLCKLNANVDVVKQTAETRNVIGLIKVENSDDYIVLGAHYDHLGMGGSGSRTPDVEAVHNGADDNASGTAGIIELAQKLVANCANLKRNIIVVAFSAEEMGLIGSKEFVKNPPVDIKKIKMMINLDMIGRLDPANPELSIGGTGTFAEATELIDRTAKDRPYKVKRSPDGYGPSDHASFYTENIPVLFFFTGIHDDYHTPADDVDKINFDGEKSVLELVYDLCTDLATRAENVTFQMSGSKQPSGYMSGGMKLKITLGIIPDMVSSESNGLRVDGVKKGGIADKAGFLKEDVIISIDNQNVTNIHDYMSRLSKLEKGKTVPIEIIRGEEKKTIQVQL